MYNKVKEMKKEMCAQLDVLKKIRKKGKVNGYDVDLAEAQAKDYMTMKARLDNIESDVASIKTEQAVQGGKLDLIIQRLNSPVENERLQGAYWRALATVTKSKMFWVIVAVLIYLIAMTGSEIKHILGWVPTVIGG